MYACACYLHPPPLPALIRYSFRHVLNLTASPITKNFPSCRAGLIMEPIFLLVLLVVYYCKNKRNIHSIINPLGEKGNFISK